MASFLPVVPAPEPLEALVRRAATIGEKARAANTRRAYTADWAEFTSWCAVHSLSALPAPPETIILYLTDLSGRAKMSTLARRVATISQAHQSAGLESPSHRSAVRLFLRALRRDKAEQGSVERGKRAILGSELKRILQAVPPTVMGARDRALLLVGYLGAFRRSELVGLNVEDLETTPAGLVIHLHRSKTDPEGKGEKKGLPPGKPEEDTCPAYALGEWLAVAKIESGPLFRPVMRDGTVLDQRLSDRAVARAIKRYAAAAGLDPAVLAGHSLRAGLATSASMAGKTERAIMNQTGHKSVTTVRRYIRDGNLFRDNAADGLL